MRKYSIRWFVGRNRAGIRNVRARTILGAILKVARVIPANAKVAISYKYGGRKVRAIC